jgi:hypothetical protein
MSRRAQENLVAAVLLFGFLAVIVMSLDYSPRSRFVPLPVAILGVILVSLQLVWQNLRSADELNVDVLELLTGQAREKAAAGSGGSGELKGRGGLFREASAFGAVALLLASFLLLGPIPSIFLFTAGFLILTGYFPWPKSLLWAAVLTATVIVVFGHILQIPLDRSILLPGLGRYFGL